MMTPDEAITKIRAILRHYNHDDVGQRRRGHLQPFDGAEDALEAIEFVVDDTDDEEFDT